MQITWCIQALLWFQQLLTRTLKLSGVTETIPAGTPIFVEGIYATNLIGNKTSVPKAFIAIEDATAGTVKVRPVDFEGQGTKEVVKADGSNVTVDDFANAKLVGAIKAGTYYMGIIRVEGAQEFDTLKKVDWSNADQTSESIEGITVHEGRTVDILAGTNTTRWSVAGVSQCIEPRCAYRRRWESNHSVGLQRSRWQRTD